MKRKGFTLVELLGVITLIGIIAVITVPVVRNVIDDAKQKGLERQIDTIIASAKNWATSNIDLLPESGSILVEMETLKKEGFLENKTIKNPVNNEEMNACVLITYNSNYNQYEYKYDEECIDPSSLKALATTIVSTSTSIASSIPTSIPACVTDGSECASGTPIAIRVNDAEVYAFYVIEDNGTEVTLIMDRNLGDNVEWYSDGSSAPNETNAQGPITALNYLNSQTATWTNIPAIENYTYVNNEDETAPGYQKLEITNGVGVLTSQDGLATTILTETIRARMLTYTEATGLGCTTSNGSCPSWLCVNLYTGYWTSTTYAGDSLGVYSIVENLRADYGNLGGTLIGVRPVITLSK